LITYLYRFRQGFYQTVYGCFCEFIAAQLSLSSWETMPHIAGTRSVSVRKSIEGTTAENPLPMILIYDFYLVEPEPSAHKIVGAEKDSGW
jgi:hypothetical protein